MGFGFEFFIESSFSQYFMSIIQPPIKGRWLFSPSQICLLSSQAFRTPWLQPSQVSDKNCWWDILSFIVSSTEIQSIKLIIIIIFFVQSYWEATYWLNEWTSAHQTVVTGTVNRLMFLFPTPFPECLLFLRTEVFEKFLHILSVMNIVGVSLLKDPYINLISV